MPLLLAPRGATLVALTLLASLTGCVLAPSASPPAYGAEGDAQLFGELGRHTRPVTTRSAEAQAYFDQGLTWLYGFNHDEAVRDFTRAAQLDPRCAMAWWGIAYAQGPNYNDPAMSEARSAAAWDAAQRALAELDDETPLERALVEALRHRYERPEPAVRSYLDAAFAQAMAAVWAAHPDADVGTLYAEAMMVRHPWELYLPDRRPARAETDVIVAVLEQTLALDPQHPGANHLYIHAVEPSADPGRGLAAADRLSAAVPASGHLRHMPSHIYVQVGLWDRSIEQNTRAMESDDAYRARATHIGAQHGYMMHNAHMLAFSAMMCGREREALAAARAMWDDVPEPVLAAYGGFFDTFMCSIYDVQKRFGRWDALLAEPEPPDGLPITKAVWRAHRAIAYAAKKQLADAVREHAAFREQMGALAGNEYALEFLTASDLFVQGEIALQQGDWDEAARVLELAAGVEDDLGYGEPPAWLQPVRHTLGAVYLAAGRPADAERVYRDDLARWRDNGWSLYGLSRALEEQGRAAEARAVRADFDRVWARADEPIDTSCRCLPAL